MHATLHPDEFGHERLGCVLCWKIPTGRFLGSLLWLDDAPGVMTAQGFHGAISKAHSRGFSSNQWERPEAAGLLFAGRDVGEHLKGKERAALAEFLLRYKAMEEIEQLVDVPFSARTATDHLAGLSHVASRVFTLADERYVEFNKREDHLNRGDYLTALEDAAFQFDVDHDDEELLLIHHTLLTEQASRPAARAATSRDEASRAHASPLEASPLSAAASEPHDADPLRVDSSSDEPIMQTPVEEVTPVGRPLETQRPMSALASPQPARDLDDGERAPTPRRGLSAPLSDIHVGHDHSDEMGASHSSDQSVVIRFVVAALLGFGVTSLFALFAMQGSGEAMRLLVGMGAGLVLTLTLYFGLLNQVMKS